MPSLKPVFTLKNLVLTLSSALVLSLPAYASNTNLTGAASNSVDAKADAARLRADYIRSNYSKFEYRVPMRDGKHLFTSVYVPNDVALGKSYPMLMTRTPYTVAPYGLDLYRNQLGPSADFEKEGFIFVMQDVRGRNMSEGEFVHMRPHNPHKKSAQDIDESSDTYDTIEWLLKHVRGHNGKVGLWGNSYPGFYSSMGAIDGHPALKAVSPQAPIADWFIGDDMHRNGALVLNMAFGFLYAVDQPRPEPTDKLSWKNFPFGTPDGYQFFLNLGPLSNVNERHFKNQLAFWNDIVAHPNYDSYWQSRNILPHLKNIKAAMLTVGGWYDTEDLYGPLNTFAQIEKLNPGISNSMIIGPWIHGGWNRTDGDRVGDAHFGFKTVPGYQAISLAFFKHHLKGGEKITIPKAYLFETGANRWRQFDAWPPKQAQEQSLYLGADGKLSMSQPGNKAGYEEYLSDPNKPVPYTTEIITRWSSDYIAADQRFATSRPDVLSWTSEVLSKDTTIAGPLQAELYVSTTASDADFVVKLIDVAPMDLPLADGQTNLGNQQLLVRGEPFRARYRDSFEVPKAMPSNQVVPVKFKLNDVLHTFKRGHKIMIQVQSSWFPFIDRNPQRYVENIYLAKAEDFIKAQHRVYYGPGQASQIKVKLLPALE